MSETDRAKLGRPSKYDPALCEKVRDLGSKGKSKAQIAAALGISRQTLDTWAALHPDFLDAVKDAHDAALAWWEDQGQDGLSADKFNATAFIFQMKNRFRSDYRDKQDHEHSGPNGGPIAVAELDLLSVEELEAYERLVLKLASAAGATQPAPDSGSDSPEEG